MNESIMFNIIYPQDKNNEGIYVKSRKIVLQNKICISRYRSWDLRVMSNCCSWHSRFHVRDKLAVLVDKKAGY